MLSSRDRDLILVIAFTCIYPIRNLCVWAAKALERIFSIESKLLAIFSSISKSKNRWQRSGIDAIKYHTWPRIPHGKVTKTQLNITKESQGSGLSHQVTTGRQLTDAKAWETQDINNTNDPQKKFYLGTVSKNILLEGLNWFHGANLTLSSDVDQDT